MVVNKMAINENFSRKTEEVEAMKKVLLKTLHETYNFHLINCRYNQAFDQFTVYCFVDRNDDDALVTMKFDYDEVLQWIM